MQTDVVDVLKDLVGHRADLQTHFLLFDLLQQVRVLCEVDAVTDSLRSEEKHIE